MTVPHGTPESHDEKDHAPDPATGHHADAHDAGHEDQHDGGALGHIGWAMWGAGVAGVLAAIVVLAAFVVATDFSFFTRGG